MLIIKPAFIKLRNFSVKNMLFAIFSFLFSGAQSANLAKATFTVAGSGGDQLGISGYIRTLNGIVGIDLDFSNVNFSHPSMPETCLDTGISYHVHNDWTYGATKSEGFGDECHYNYTNDHYDPWYACGPNSAQEACTNNGGCIGPSSIFASDEGYVCEGNFTEYLNVPYSCEMGDWSGKYGLIFVDNVTTTYTTVLESFWEVGTQTIIPPSQSIATYSIVLHCGGKRVWCAALNRAQEPQDNPVLTADQVLEADFELDSEAGSLVIKNTGI